MVGIAARNYCELQYKCHVYSDLSIDNAEMMKKIPLKSVICKENSMYIAIRRTSP